MAVGCSVYKLIYVVRVLTTREKIIVKQNYWECVRFSYIQINANVCLGLAGNLLSFNCMKGTDN